MGVLRGKFLLIVLATLIVGSSITPIIAQQTTVTYSVHVDFLYASCSLSSLRITLNDQTGRVVATSQIPDAFEVTLTYSTATPTNSLTVSAFAQATIGSFYSGAVSGSRTITVGRGGDYWILVQLR
jgi:hypothetical protein